MGAVYLAQHPRLPRSDALKILDSEQGRKPEFRARFEREADIAARMRHPNIVAVYDRGAEGDHLWIAMQYVEGQNVDDLIKSGPSVLTIPRVVHIIRNVARALDYAHQQGSLHRDVKPANILVTPSADEPSGETAMLTDFGIAKAMSSMSADVTKPGDVVGTFAYAAPEQLLGHHIDRRVDIYALGCTLYRMLTGAAPYPGASLGAVMHAHLTAPPPRPTATQPYLPPAIDNVIAKALAKDPNQRYSTCRELADDAARALGVPIDFTGSGPIPAHLRPPPARSTGNRRLLITGASVAAVAAIGASVAIGVVGFNSDNSSDGTTTTTTTTRTTTTTTETTPAGPTATATDGSFRVSVPNGWSEQSPQALMKLAATGGNANLLVSINPQNERGATLQQSAERGVDQVGKLDGAVIDSGGIESTTVDGEEARRYTYTITRGNQQARGRQLLVRHKGVEYIVTFTGTAQAFNGAVADYEAVMRSWKWLN